MEYVGGFINNVHEMLVSTKSECDASTMFRDIKISFSDGTVSYNRLLLGVLEPVVLNAMRDMNVSDLEDVTIIYPDKSLECLKELLTKPQSFPCEIVEDILEFEWDDRIDSKVSEIFYCSECDRHYSTKKQLRKHFYYKHFYSSKNSDNKKARVQQQKKSNVTFVGDVVKHACSKCERTFKRVQGLIRHIETVHSTENKTRFFCNFCKSSFNRKDNLFKHVSKAHPDI